MEWNGFLTSMDESRKVKNTGTHKINKSPLKHRKTCCLFISVFVFAGGAPLWVSHASVGHLVCVNTLSPLVFFLLPCAHVCAGPCGCVLCTVFCRSRLWHVWTIKEDMRFKSDNSVSVSGCESVWSSSVVTNDSFVCPLHPFWLTKKTEMFVLRHFKTKAKLLLGRKSLDLMF